MLSRARLLAEIDIQIEQIYYGTVLSFRRSGDALSYNLCLNSWQFIDTYTYIHGRINRLFSAGWLGIL